MIKIIKRLWRGFIKCRKFIAAIILLSSVQIIGFATIGEDATIVIFLIGGIVTLIYMAGEE